MNTFYPKSQHEWRQWLEAHHDSEQSVWLICYKKASGKPSLSWSEAVDEALCFGWIDSTRKTVDAEQFVQLFARRKPGSTWSQINKQKVEQLVAEGRMTTAGLAVIETARQNGSWTILDSAERLEIPEDLDAAFLRYPGAKDFFLGLSKSARKMLLQWLVLAKRAETRQQRIGEIAAKAGESQKPKGF